MERLRPRKIHYWLMKNEPAVYSIHDLERDQTTEWNGIRNYQVRNLLRDEMKVGDRAVFYHSSAGSTTGAAGTMVVVGEPYPDPLQFDPESEYFDSKSTKESPRWYALLMKHEMTFPTLVTLPTLRTLDILQSSRLLQKGNRLSVISLSKMQFDAIVKEGTRMPNHKRENTK